jgi:hypothetical protein
METAEGAGNIQHTLVGNFLVADQQLRRGDAAAAIPHLERTFELGAYRNAEAIVGLGNAWLASARAHLGDLDPNVFSGPLEQAQAGRSRSGEAAVRLQRAIALAGSPEPDWDQAFDDFERAIALFASIDARPDQARAVHAYANALDAAGRNEESRSQRETAMTMFDETGIRPDAVPASEQALVPETRATSIPIVEPTGPTRRPKPFRSIEPAFVAAGRLTDGNRSRCSHLAARLRWSCIHAVAPWSHEARHSTKGRCVMTTEELVRTESHETEVPPERRETVSVHRPRFWWGVAAGAAVIAVVVGMALAVWLIGDEEVAQQVPIDSERELMQGLVNEGYLPAQALEPAPRDERALLEDVVNRGLVPAQALEPAPRDERALLEDVVNRGLVPAQALEPAAATSIYTAEEQALIDAVRKGFVPEQAIEEMMIIKRLTNQGLIPAGTGSG